MKPVAMLLTFVGATVAAWLALAAAAHADGDYPLHQAAVIGSFDEMLEHSGTEIGLNERDTWGSMDLLFRPRPTSYAARLNPQAVWDALAARLDPGMGWTPLMYVAAHGHANVIENMVAAGANPDLPDRDGNTALMIAIQYAHPEAAAALIGIGADMTTKNANGESAFTLAVASDQPAVVESILHEASTRCDPSVRASLMQSKATADRYISEFHRQEIAALMHQYPSALLAC